MSGKVLFACSKCFSRHPFEELSSGTQLCKNCRGTTSVVKCSYCRSEFQPSSKSQNICKKCEYNLSKYGKPSTCECCKIVAAFGGSKCMRCASYEARYGPPMQCDECKLRSAFDRRDENKKVNGKLLCWLCTCAYKRAYLKAQQEGRISSKKRPHEKSYRDSIASAKKISRSDITRNNSSNPSGVSAVNSAGLDMPEKISRTGSSGSGNGSIGLGSIAAPAVVSIDPNSADHVVAMTTLKERIASLEKRLTQKDKELLEKDKLLTELKGKNFEKEIEMRNKLKDIDRLNEMKVENLNRKITTLLKEVASLKKSNKRNNSGAIIANREKERERRERENVSPKEEITAVSTATESLDKYDDKDEVKEDVKIEEDSGDSRAVNKEEDKHPIKTDEETKEEEEKNGKREEREKSVKSDKSEKSTKSENSESNKEEVEHFESRSNSRSVSRSPSRSKSRSCSQSRSRSRSHSQSRSRSGSRSRSRSDSRSHSRSNSPDSN